MSSSTASSKDPSMSVMFPSASMSIIPSAQLFGDSLPLLLGVSAMVGFDALSPQWDLLVHVGFEYGGTQG